MWIVIRTGPKHRMLNLQKAAKLEPQWWTCRSTTDKSARTKGEHWTTTMTDWEWETGGEWNTGEDNRDDCKGEGIKVTQNMKEVPS